jgi:hypothetical protein
VLLDLGSYFVREKLLKFLDLDICKSGKFLLVGEDERARYLLRVR